jgi:hypothetical protein
LKAAFANFFAGQVMYPAFKKRQGKQSLQYPAKHRMDALNKLTIAVSAFVVLFPSALCLINLYTAYSPPFICAALVTVMRRRFFMG